MTDFINKTISQQMKYMAKKYPNDVMVNYTDRDYKRTWKEFDEECEIIARGFLALGLKKGDHISIWATNVPEWMLTFFASAKMGGILITVNTSYKVFELEYQLRQSDTNALVLIDGFKGTSYVDIVNELCPMLKDSEPGKLNNPMLPELKAVIFAGDECPAGMIDFKSLYELANNVSAEELEEIDKGIKFDDVVNIQYTSGTTGFPKGVMLTHYKLTKALNLTML